MAVFEFIEGWYNPHRRRSSIDWLSPNEFELAQTVAYTYDPRGRLGRVVNARGHALDYGSAAWGGLGTVLHYPTVAEADAGTNLARTVSYTYDLAGNPLTTSDTDLTTSAPAGADPTLYPAGRLMTFAYDALDRVDIATAHYLPQGDVTLDSDYDRFGNRNTLTLTDGVEVLTHTWQFNDLDRLMQVTLPGSASDLVFDYYANDDLKQLLHGNGATTDYVYWAQGPVQQITVKDAARVQRLRLEYTPDALLNVDLVTEEHAVGTSFPYDFDYDGINRLSRAQLPAGLRLPVDTPFDYDTAGNRDDDPAIPSPWSYDGNNRIQSSPTPAGGADTAYTFDADGNVETRTPPSGPETFSYDFVSRLRSWTGTTTADYLYDPFGRRLRKQVGGTPTWFLWDGDRLLAEYDGAGVRLARYAYAGGFAPVQVALGGPGSEQVYHVHTDHLDTPRLLTDNAGTPVWRAAYEAFGTAHISTDPDGNPVPPDLGIEFNIRFPGQYFDAETGLHYNRFRYYDPSIGRYISADPLGPYLPGENLYAYSRNSPISFFDPFGLDWQYSQSTGSLTHVDNSTGVSTPVGTGYSGYGAGLNNPAQQSTPSVGPIPQGSYTIGPQTNSPNAGPGVLPLTPDPGTDTFGRDALQIHGDNAQNNQSASQGCIVTGPDVRNAIAGSGDNTLVVLP